MRDDDEPRDDPETAAAKEEGRARGGDQSPPEPGSGKDPDELSEAGREASRGED